ncbi:MAG TPA: twin-arginine translocase TatA/TatE family subunit [Anaerolineales bacterium]
MPFGIQPIHIVIVVIVALIIFGPRRLPEVGRWVGRSITEIRKGTQEMTATLREEMNKPVEEEQHTIAKPAPVQSVPVDRKFCTKCGAPNPSDAVFCNKCGNPFQTQA